MAWQASKLRPQHAQLVFLSRARGAQCFEGVSSGAAASRRQAATEAAQHHELAGMGTNGDGSPTASVHAIRGPFATAVLFLQGRPPALDAPHAGCRDDFPGALQPKKLPPSPPHVITTSSGPRFGSERGVSPVDWKRTTCCSVFRRLTEMVAGDRLPQFFRPTASHGRLANVSCGGQREGGTDNIRPMRLVFEALPETGRPPREFSHGSKMAEWRGAASQAFAIQASPVRNGSPF